MKPSRAALLPFAFLLSLATAGAAEAADSATLAKIRDAALADDWAFQRLADLTDKIGPRLSGSPGAEAAVRRWQRRRKRPG